MVNEIMLPQGNSLPILNGHGELPAKVRKQIEQALAAKAGGAFVGAAAVQATAFVAHTALVQTAMLSGEEAALSAADPIAAERYAAIVNDFVFVARNIIRGMAS